MLAKSRFILLIFFSLAAFSSASSASAASISESAESMCTAGQSLQAILKRLRADGHRVIYSSEMVKQWMRVVDLEEQLLQSAYPEATLKQILSPFGLSVEQGPANSLLIVSDTGAASTPRHFVLGRVLHAQTGKPLSGVRVVLDNGHSAGISEQDGCFILPVTKLGKYTLSFQAAGFKASETTLLISRSEPAWVEAGLQMDITADTEWEEVEVVASRRLPSRLSLAKKAYPSYPSRARRAGVSGYVVLEFTVAADGRVVDAEVIEAEPEGYFEESGLSAVKRLRYRVYAAGAERPSAVAGVRYRFTYIN